MTSLWPRKDTIAVMVGDLGVGGCHPIRVQSMTNTDTADIERTVSQVKDLAEAGSEMVRVTVNTAPAAAAVPEIKQRLLDQGVSVPLVGDFHFNGHNLLRQHPDCAQALAKYRINPGNVGAGKKRDDNFATICEIAADQGKAIRIGVNGGSLDQNLVMQGMKENTEQNLNLDSWEIINRCMVESALTSTEAALSCGLKEDGIIISCKVSDLNHLVRIYKDLAAQTKQPLHLGLTEAGMGDKGVVSSSAALALLLSQGIGDTIRVSLTPEPGGDRRREVLVAQELLQALALRSFNPSVTACPGCGRTTSTVFQELAEEVQGYMRRQMPLWKDQYPGVEEMTLAVMGCVVNGPGESKAANIGISLPGTGEAPTAPVYVDGRPFKTLKGTQKELAAGFRQIVDDYVREKYGRSLATS